MNFFNKLRLASAASKTVDAIGKIPVPHGPSMTYAGAVILILVQFFTTSGDLFGPEWKPWVAIALSVLTGLHNITALAWPEAGKWTTSAAAALFMQVAGIAIQTLNQLVPAVGPEWQAMLTDCIQVLMSLQSLKFLNQAGK